MGKVLFVDDEKHVIDLLKQKLRNTGINCLYASSGREALNYIRQQHIDVIISDIVMPDIDGLTLLQEVSKISPQTVRVVLSGNTYLPMLVDAINEGHVYQYIQKPFKVDYKGIQFIKDLVIKAKQMQDESNSVTKLGNLLALMHHEKDSFELAVTDINYNVLFSTNNDLPQYFRDMPYELFLIDGHQYHLYKWEKE